MKKRTFTRKSCIERYRVSADDPSMYLCCVVPPPPFFHFLLLTTCYSPPLGRVVRQALPHRNTVDTVGLYNEWKTYDGFRSYFPCIKGKKRYVS
jgi:hypothetical protein